MKPIYYWVLRGGSSGRRASTSAIKYSPAEQIPADQSSRSDAMQKKVIDWPISNHEPVSCTLKKKLSVIPATAMHKLPVRLDGGHDAPSVNVRATSSSEKGGSPRASLSSAKVTESIMYGATILKT